MKLEPCPECKSELAAKKVGPHWGRGQSINLECSGCDFRKTFYEIYDMRPQLRPTVWKTETLDGTSFQEYYVPRKHDYVLEIINDFLKSG